MKDFIGKNYPDLVSKGYIHTWFLQELAPEIAQISRKGGAVITAIKNLSYFETNDNDIVIYTDADISSDLRLTGILINPLFNGSHVTISSRWHKDSTIVNRGIKEKLSSRI